MEGHEFYFKDKPQGSWDGLTRGKVLEARRPSHVKFTWQGGGLDSVVTYDLEPLASGGTRLTLVHDGFRGLSGLFLAVMLKFGWGGLVKKLLPEMADHLAVHGFARPFPSPSKAARAGVQLDERPGG